MDAGEYELMLRRQDYQSLLGILAIIEADKYPERVAAVRAEIVRRKENGEAAAALAPAKPKWKIQKNWHKINAVIVGILSAFSCYSIFTASETGIYVDLEELFLGAVGLVGILLYFWKFALGHYVLLLWWLPQLVEIETDTFKYSLFSGIRVGLEFKLGPLEISTNTLAIVSFAWLVVFKRYYEEKVKSEAEAKPSHGL